MGEACVGSISEIFDAEAPYSPRGCIAQAWSVAEVLRRLAENGPVRTRRRWAAWKTGEDVDHECGRGKWGKPAGAGPALIISASAESLASSVRDGWSDIESPSIRRGAPGRIRDDEQDRCGSAFGRKACRLPAFGGTEAAFPSRRFAADPYILSSELH